MSIQGKLVGAALIVAALVVVGGGVGAFGVHTVETTLEGVRSSQGAALELRGRQVDHLLWVERVAVLAADPSAQRLAVALDPAECAFGAWYHGGGPAAFPSDDGSVARLLAAVEAPHTRMHRAAAELDAGLRAGSLGREEVLERFRMGVVAPATEVQGLLEQANVAAEASVAATLRTYHERRRAGFLIIVAGTLVGIVLVLAAGVVFARSLTVPLRRVVGMIQELGRGHLSQRLGLRRRDEIGLLADTMDAFAEALQRDFLGVLNRLARGEVDVTVKRVDDGDEIGPALIQIRDSLRRLVDRMGGLVEAGASGRLGERADVTGLEGSYREVVEGVNRVLDTVGAPLGEAAAVLERVSGGDLAVRMEGRYRGDYDRIRVALNGALESMERALVEVADSAERVAAASEEIDAGSQRLADGSNAQASSLEEVAASLQELAAMAGQNAASAREGQGVAETAGRSLESVAAAMVELSSAMDRIREASRATGTVVRTIDEIAFQTNLLALNAAVEAARAGESGRGFAVVAAEVRSLALRSAKAAKETERLIQDGVASADEGVAIEEGVVRQLTELKGGIGRVQEVMVEIVAASGQQSDGVDQIHDSVESMNGLTQTTAASAEESAGVAAGLTRESGRMRTLVRRFVVDRARGAGQADDAPPVAASGDRSAVTGARPVPRARVETGV